MSTCYVFRIDCKESGENWISWRRGLPHHSEEWLGGEQSLKSSIAKYGREGHLKTIVCVCQSVPEAQEQIEAERRRLERAARGEVKRQRTGPRKRRKLKHRPEFLEDLSKRSKNNRYRKMGSCLAYIVTDPSGREHFVSNMEEWCGPRNLTAYAMRWVAQGRRRHHKKWLARLVAPGETWVAPKATKPAFETEIVFAPSRSSVRDLKPEITDADRW